MCVGGGFTPEGSSKHLVSSILVVTQKQLTWSSIPLTHHAVDVAVVGHVGGRGQAEGQLQDLHSGHPAAPDQDRIRGHEAGCLEDEDGLVAEVVRSEEDREEEGEVGVCLHRVDLIHHL